MSASGRLPPMVGSSGPTRPRALSTAVDHLLRDRQVHRRPHRVDEPAPRCTRAISGVLAAGGRRPAPTPRTMVTRPADVVDHPVAPRAGGSSPLTRRKSIEAEARVGMTLRRLRAARRRWPCPRTFSAGRLISSSRRGRGPRCGPATARRAGARSWRGAAARARLARARSAARRRRRSRHHDAAVARRASSASRCASITAGLGAQLP